MIIQHFVNSFLAFSNKDCKIACDPWIGSANYGGWHSFPLVEEKTVVSTLDDCDYIYISHLHSDHFCKSLLRKLDISKTTFLIKDFKLKTLRNALIEIGAQNIVELKAFQEFNIENTFNLTIVPQFESNSSGSGFRKGILPQ